MPKLTSRWPRTLGPVAACITLAVAHTAWAQPAPAEEAPVQLAQAELERQVFIYNDIETTVMRSSSGAEPVVKGAPYCAEAVHETVQWLADGQGGVGNRIARQQITQLCRDGEGRTRQVIDSNGRKLVYLADPVAGERWVLDPERKTARRSLGARGMASDLAVELHGLRERAVAAADRALVAAGRAPRAAPGGATTAPAVAPLPTLPPLPPLPPAAPVPPQPVVISRADGDRQTEIRVLRLPPGSGHEALQAELDMPPAAVQWRAQTLAPRGAGSVSPLPAKDVEGLRANGQRSTWVIEAGKLGNDKPIQISREVWSSPDLMVTLASRDFDPRTGETSYRLRHIKRGEPDPALLRVPADYNKPQRPGSKASAPQG
jgi:hypothetical protein